MGFVFDLAVAAVAAAVVLDVDAVVAFALDVFVAVAVIVLILVVGVVGGGVGVLVLVVGGALSALAQIAIACAGTSLARCPPNKSVNEIMKYLTPFSLANLARSVAISYILPDA